MTQYVQFADSAQGAIQSVFGCPQDPDVYPNQGEVEDDDPRYLLFINPPVMVEADPVEKLKAFLAANPDVAAILS
jgi:hypothetical protein